MIQFGKYKFENVKCFTYMGTALNNEIVVPVKINKKIKTGNRAYFSTF